MREMTMRERMLAAIEGRRCDFVPFVQYDNLAGPNDEIWARIGRDNMGLLAWSAVHRVDAPNCHAERTHFEREGRHGTRTVLHTPEGQLAQEVVYEPNHGSAVRREHFVKTPEDYRALRAYLADMVVVPDVERFIVDERRLGDAGLAMPTMFLTPYQWMWVEWASMEDFAMHLVDCPDAVEECMEIMGRHHRAVSEILRGIPREVALPMVNFGDNATAPLVGERYFRKYCVPWYNECAEALADRGTKVFVHLDGDMRAFWGAMSESRISGIDSFTPYPANDTRISEAVSMWPEMTLWVNFPPATHLSGPKAVYEKAREILDEAGHTGRLQIQISEDILHDVWKESFPEIVKAIREFGAPG
jgi:hypothetical protein